MYKKENQEMLIKLLDENDVKILTSIKYIANPDFEKISSFFKNEKFSERIEFILGSLEERLVIFRKEKDGKTIYWWNSQGGAYPASYQFNTQNYTYYWVAFG